MISGFQINDACYVPQLRAPSHSLVATFRSTHTSSLNSHKSHITNHFRSPPHMQTHNVTWRIFSAFASIMGQSFPSATTPVWQQQHQHQCSATAAITITQTKHIQHIVRVRAGSADVVGLKIVDYPGAFKVFSCLLCLSFSCSAAFSYSLSLSLFFSPSFSFDWAELQYIKLIELSWGFPIWLAAEKNKLIMIQSKHN